MRLHPQAFISWSSSSVTSVQIHSVSYKPYTRTTKHGYECRLLQTVMPVQNTSFLKLSTNLTLDSERVKPKSQLCINQNNNPQRFLLPPFPDAQGDSFAALEKIHWGSSALQTRLHSQQCNDRLPQNCLPARACDWVCVSKHKMCLGGNCNVTVAQQRCGVIVAVVPLPVLFCPRLVSLICVCIYTHLLYAVVLVASVSSCLWHTEIMIRTCEHVWISRVTMRANVLCCPAENDLRSVSTVILQRLEGTKGLDKPEECTVFSIVWMKSDHKIHHVTHINELFSMYCTFRK